MHTNLEKSDASKAAALLADEIITDGIKSGSRLYIRELVARTGLGATPLREGVTRLLARGLVEIADQRGFYVSNITDDDAADLLWLLNIIEQAVLRRAMDDGGKQWIERIEAALEAFLSFNPGPRERPAANTRRFCDLHKALHMAFVSGSGSPRILGFLDVLYDQEIRLCHTRMPSDRLEGLRRTCDASRHAELAASIMRRDFDAAAAALTAERDAIAAAFGIRRIGRDKDGDAPDARPAK